MEWHVWGPQDAEPTIYHDPILLQAALAQYAPTETVFVRTYKRIEAGAQWYNAPGGAPFPTKPTNPPPSEAVSVTHIHRK